MTDPAPQPAAPIFPPRLSPAGRERFGELLAKQLWLLGGGVAALIVVPALLGQTALPPLVTGVAILIAVISPATGTMLHYMTVERRDEPPT